MGTREQHGTEQLADRTGDLLARARAGETQALGDLVGQVHAELCDLARSVRRGRTPAPSLSTVELVNEAYLRLRGGQAPSINDRQHFMNMVAKTMRWIIISHYRSAQRRPALGAAGGEARADEVDGEQLLALNGALDALELEHPELARLVELRFFLGRDMKEIAELMEVPERSLYRHWERARRWLYRSMVASGAQPGDCLHG